MDNVGMDAPAGHAATAHPATCGRMSRESSQIAQALLTALWHASRLPSGHTGKYVDGFVLKVIRELSPNWAESEELLQQGRIIAYQADKAWNGDSNWEEFILTRLDWELPDYLKKLRCRGLTGIGKRNNPPPVVSITSRENGDASRFATEYVDYEIPDPRPSIESQVNAQQIVEIVRQTLPPDLFQVLALHFGLDGNEEHSIRELAKQIGESRSTTDRMLNRAKARAISRFVLSERELVELTDELLPFAQGDVLQFMGIEYSKRPNGSLVVLREHAKTSSRQRSNGIEPKST